MALTLKHPVTGKPLVIENPLLAEHVQIGRLLWYFGYTSTWEWDCPAVIAEINEEKKEFRVRSFDDMKVQHQWYSYSTNEGSPTSRMTMRLSDADEVNKYLLAQRQCLEAEVTRAKDRYDRAKEALESFDRERAALKL